jgi:hypothetical protein
MSFVGYNVEQKRQNISGQSHIIIRFTNGAGKNNVYLVLIHQLLWTISGTKGGEGTCWYTVWL